MDFLLLCATHERVFETSTTISACVAWLAMDRS
jgi:hypothetical protein